MSEMENAMLSNEEREYIKDYIDETLDRRMVESKDWKAIYDRDVARLKSLIESQGAGKQGLRDEIDKLKAELKETGDRYGKCAVELDFAKKNVAYEQSVNEPFRKRLDELADERDKLKVELEFMRAERDALKAAQGTLQRELRIAQVSLEGCCKRAQSYSESFNELSAIHVKVKAELEDAKKRINEILRNESEHVAELQGKLEALRTGCSRTHWEVLNQVEVQKETIAGLMVELEEAKKNHGFVDWRDAAVKRQLLEVAKLKDKLATSRQMFSDSAEMYRKLDTKFNEKVAEVNLLRGYLNPRDHDIDDTGSELLWHLGCDMRFQLTFNAAPNHKWTISQFGRTVSATRLSEALKDLQA